MKIDDALIAYLGELSRLELSEEEKDARRKDLEQVIGYVEKLSELDTEGAEELLHPTQTANVFREDVVANEDKRESMLSNAPSKKGDYFTVFRTVEE